MTSAFLSRKRTRAALVVGAAIAVASTGTVAAQAAARPSDHFGVAADSFSGHGTVTGNVLRNDLGATAVVQNTNPAHGSVTVNADGTFTYTPQAGFTGTDTFTYTASDAVQLFQDAAANGSPIPAAHFGRRPNGTTTKISGEGFGSSLAPVPGRPGCFYGLTDRGPNADAPDGNKSEMVLNFAPEIGEFKLVNGKAKLLKTVTLKGPKSLGGVKYSGRPPHDTTEVIDDVAATNATLKDGKVTPFEPNAHKTLYEVDIKGATDVSGLTIDGKSPEAFVGTDGTSAALAALATAGVHVAAKQPYLQVGGLVTQRPGHRRPSGPGRPNGPGRPDGPDGPGTRANIIAREPGPGGPDRGRGAGPGRRVGGDRAGGYLPLGRSKRGARDAPERPAGHGEPSAGCDQSRAGRHEPRRGNEPSGESGAVRGRRVDRHLHVQPGAERGMADDHGRGRRHGAGDRRVLRGPSNPGVPDGSYVLTGNYSASGGLVLIPDYWINEPAGYEMVGLSGPAPNGNSMHGKVQGVNCTTFSVTR